MSWCTHPLRKPPPPPPPPLLQEPWCPQSSKEKKRKKPKKNPAKNFRLKVFRNLQKQRQKEQERLVALTKKVYKALLKQLGGRRRQSIYSDDDLKRTMRDLHQGKVEDPSRMLHFMLMDDLGLTHVPKDRETDRILRHLDHAQRGRGFGKYLDAVRTAYSVSAPFLELAQPELAPVLLALDVANSVLP